MGVMFAVDVYVEAVITSVAVLLPPCGVYWAVQLRLAADLWVAPQALIVTPAQHDTKYFKYNEPLCICKKATCIYYIANSFESSGRWQNEY